MIQAQEKAPGSESKGLVNLDTPSIPTQAGKTTATALITGVHVVVVETASGKFRRRVYLTLASAQRAADRAIVAGHPAHLILCKLIPADGAA